MRNNHHPARIDAVATAQSLRPRLRHHNQQVGALEQPVEHRQLGRRRIGKHGVHGHRQRQIDLVDQGENVIAGVAAENPELMLKPQRFGPAGHDLVRRAGIVAAVVGADRLDRRGIRDAGAIIHRVMVDNELRITVGERIETVRSEGCEATVAGQRVADQRDPPERRAIAARPGRGLVRRNTYGVNVEQLKFPLPRHPTGMPRFKNATHPGRLHTCSQPQQ